LAAVVANIIPQLYGVLLFFVFEHRAVKFKFYTVADNTVFSCSFQKQ